jgi:hypothetical protein
MRTWLPPFIVNALIEIENGWRPRSKLTRNRIREFRFKQRSFYNNPFTYPAKIG